MNIELVTVFLLTLLPIIASPGPANIFYALSGSTFGIKKSIPFWLATNLTSVLQSLAVGFGFNYLMQTNDYALDIIKYLGVLFLFYLSYKFLKVSVVTDKSIKPLTFKDGVIVEILNAKYLLIPSVMFSQFHKPSDGYEHIIFLVFVLLLTTLTSSMFWIVGGSFISSFVSNKKAQEYQSLFFSILLFLTALWLGLN